MKCQQRRRANGNGERSDPACAQEQRSESAEQAVAQRQVGRTLATSAQDDQLLLEQEILGDHRPHATGATHPRGYDGRVKQGEQELSDLRFVSPLAAVCCPLVQQKGKKRANIIVRTLLS